MELAQSPGKSRTPGSAELGSKGAVSLRATDAVAETLGRGTVLAVGGRQYILEEIIPPLRVA